MAREWVRSESVWSYASPVSARFASRRSSRASAETQLHSGSVWSSASHICARLHEPSPLWSIRRKERDDLDQRDDLVGMMTLSNMVTSPSMMTFSCMMYFVSACIFRVKVPAWHIFDSQRHCVRRRSRTLCG